MEVPVLLPKVFNYPFTYSNDSKKIKNLNQGDIVIVPFGKKKRKLVLSGIKLIILKKNSTLKKLKRKFLIYVWTKR